MNPEGFWFIRVTASRNDTHQGKQHGLTSRRSRAFQKIDSSAPTIQT